MPEKSYKQLQQAFCLECYARAQRALEVLDKLEQNNLNIDARDCFDQLHQEFDSMVGASRALNYSILEKFSRSMASFSRFLRNRFPEPALPEHLELLRHAINLWLSCDSKIQNCLSNRDIPVKAITEQIDSILQSELNN